MRLGTGTLSCVPPGVTRFGYDRDAQAVGIVHFGIGAFHRAHQAWYTDQAMDAGDRDWMITGVSLRSGDVAAQMNPQDGLYTQSERSAAGDVTSIIGAVREVLVADAVRQTVIDRLSAPHTHIVSFTITEKGYCRAPDGSLDLAQAEQGFYSLLTEALSTREQAGVAGLTLISCDNLADNGRQLAGLVREYLDRHNPGLIGWFDRECACPSTMIDRIVPAATDADRARVSAILGLEDMAAVVTEPFSQWIIENHFAGPRPRWEAVGAKLVADVAPYETAKLRMLNGAHSALAYLGLRRGHDFVHQAIADPELRVLVERLMVEEAAPTIAAAPGQDLRAYVNELIARFANPALNHRLRQIAMDGSQKLPQRWIATLNENRAAGRSSVAIETAIEAWLCYTRGEGGSVDDPLADAFERYWRNGDGLAVRASIGL